MPKVIRNGVARLVLMFADILRRFDVVMMKYPRAFGHQAWNIEYVARRYFLEYKRWPRLIVFQQSNQVANVALYNHHQRYGVKIYSSDSIPTRLFRIGSAHQKQLNEANQATNQKLRRSIEVITMRQLHVDPNHHLESVAAFPLRPDQITRANDILCGLDLTPNMYVAFQDKDLAYRRKMVSPGAVNSKLRRYDYYRNTSISRFRTAVDLLAERDLIAVRMGRDPERPSELPNSIDYASIKDRDDGFGDLALASSCKFYLGPNSGIWLLLRVFNKPVCLINTFPWPWESFPMRVDSLVMPKKLWHTLDKRFLTIYEMIDMETHTSWKKMYRDSFFTELSIEPVENSEDEIAEAAKEINLRLDGAWCGSTYPVSEFLGPENVGRHTRASFPAYFVENNPDIFPNI